MRDRELAERAASSAACQMRKRRFDLGGASRAPVLALAHLSIACVGGGEIESASEDYTQW